MELLVHAGAHVSLPNESKNTPLSVLNHCVKDTNHHLSDTNCVKETEAVAKILRDSLADFVHERQVEGERWPAKDTSSVQDATSVPMAGKKLPNKNMAAKGCKKLTIRVKKR